ncbi:MAG: hypothetical protein ACYDEE_14705, partial [Ignavibacteriaceae bacterium]
VHVKALVQTHVWVVHAELINSLEIAIGIIMALMVITGRRALIRVIKIMLAVSPAGLMMKAHQEHQLVV